jgi:5-methylcytosine-specific restriction protein A
MTPTALASAGDLILEVAARLHEGSSGMSEADVVAALAATRELTRLVSRVQVEAVAELQRRGTFATKGYRRPEGAVAEMLTIERGRALEIVRSADHVSARRDLQGQVLEPVLPAMADAFAGGTASLQHVNLIARVMDRPAARRIPPYAWAGIEQHLASIADTCTPTELAKLADELVCAYDQDGAEPDDDRPEPVQVNELRVTRWRNGGGEIHGTFEDPVRFAMIATVVDAKSRPLTKDDHRSAPSRAADALAEVCGWVLDHGDQELLPDAAGERPRVALTLRFTDLLHTARAGLLDFSGTPLPSEVRMMCCDAGLIPIVLGGHGEPLDVGRDRRSIPTAIRRAVTVRDHGCAHPGCDRPPSWTEIHHIKEWSRGGHTRLDNLVMLCRTHHREIHATEWLVRIARDGLPEFIPPAWLDKDQRPRRHPRLLIERELTHAV